MVLAALICCASLAAAQPGVPAGLHGHVVVERMRSAALEHNLLGDAAERSLYVYLPPSYAQGARRYPVIYFLHGYQGDLQTTAARYLAGMDAAMQALGADHEMIVVFPDGSNRLGGSFYADSVTTGDWEQHIVREIVSLVDGKYRTLAQAESRGIAGHSMGGNGALRLGMRHPDVFGAVYALSPCCMWWDREFGASNLAWEAAIAMKPGDTKAPFLAQIFVAIAAAWSPDPAQPPFFEELPVEEQNGELKARPRIEDEWSANMPVYLVDQYRANLKQLRGIALDVGLQDQFASILTGTREFATHLKANGIAYQEEEYEGNHVDHVAERMAQHALPFFARTLKFGNR